MSFGSRRSCPSRNVKPYETMRKLCGSIANTFSSAATDLSCTSTGATARTWSSCASFSPMLIGIGALPTVISIDADGGCTITSAPTPDDQDHHHHFHGHADHRCQRTDGAMQHILHDHVAVQLDLLIRSLRP